MTNEPSAEAATDRPAADAVVHDFGAEAAS